LWFAAYRLLSGYAVGGGVVSAFTFDYYTRFREKMHRNFENF
jgi:hypothetical protein